MWQNEQHAKAERPRGARKELGSQPLVAGREALAAVSGWPEAPVGQLRAWTSPRQWEPLGSWPGKDRRLPCAGGGWGRSPRFRKTSGIECRDSEGRPTLGRGWWIAQLTRCEERGVWVCWEQLGGWQVVLSPSTEGTGAPGLQAESCSLHTWN